MARPGPGRPPEIRSAATRFTNPVIVPPGRPSRPRRASLAGGARAAAAVVGRGPARRAPTPARRRAAPRSGGGRLGAARGRRPPAVAGGRGLAPARRPLAGARRALLLAGRRLHLAVVDHATPGARLLFLHLDIGLEAREVRSDRPLHVAHPASRLLDQRARLDVEGHLHAGELGGELVERHDPRVVQTLCHVPLDAIVGALVEDLGVELLRNAPDLRLERDVALVLLRDPLEAVHEARPLLELGPLVVGRAKRHRYVDRLLYRHSPTLADARRAGRRVAAARHETLPGLLRQAGCTARLVDRLADRVLDALADLRADFPAVLLDGLGAVRERTLGELASALRGEGRKHRKTGAGGHALHPGDRARTLPETRQRALTSVVRDVLGRFARHSPDRGPDYVTHVLGHHSILRRLRRGTRLPVGMERETWTQRPVREVRSAD